MKDIDKVKKELYTILGKEIHSLGICNSFKEESKLSLHLTDVVIKTLENIGV